MRTVTTITNRKDLNAPERPKEEDAKDQGHEHEDREEDDVIKEILQDPAKFEELLKEREKPPMKTVKKHRPRQYLRGKARAYEPANRRKTMTSLEEVL